MPGTIAAVLESMPVSASALLAPSRRHLTHGALRDRMVCTLSALNAAGIGREDRVAIVLPNGPDMALTLLSVMMGATAAPLNPDYRAPEFAFYLSDLKAKAVIVQADRPSEARGVARQMQIPVIELTPRVEDAAGVFDLSLPDADASFVPAEPGDTALVLHTSGTTGRPKIVPLTQANLRASMQNIATTLRLSDADRCLNVMPLFHIHGIVAALLASLGAGGSVVCTPGFHPVEFFNWLTDLEPTWYTAVPTIHQAVLTQIERLPNQARAWHLRFARSSSSALPPAVTRGLEETLGVPVIEAYGMTEASHQIASNPLPPRPRKVGSVGPAAGPEVAILTADGEFCKPGERGEIALKGADVMSGYQDNPQANASAFVNGWLRTGDEGYLDDDGYLFITGRIKEMINRGGEKIAPLEVDAVLLEHPAIRQALTFAVPHYSLGEDVGAVVVLREGAAATDAEIRAFAAERLAYHKVPHLIIFRDDVPKGATGKPQRVGLAEKLGVRIERVTETTEFVAPRDELESQIAAVWQDVLGYEPVGIHDRFLDLGGDSLLAARVVSTLRAMLGIPLELVHFFETPTVADIAELVRRMRAGTGADVVSQLVDALDDLSEDDLRNLLDESGAVE